MTNPSTTADQASGDAGSERHSSLGRRALPSNALLYRLAIHEAGHAVARIQLDACTLELITLDLARERGGGVSWIPDDDDEATETRLTNELIIMLAGRAAEEVLVGSVSAYSGGPEFSDLAQANELALRMVLGFGTALPPLHLPTTDLTMLLTMDKELAGRIHQRLAVSYEGARALGLRQKAAVKYKASMILHERRSRYPTPTSASWPASSVEASPTARCLAEHIAPAMPCIYVAGNHEFYKDSIEEGLEEGRRAAEGFANVLFLEQDMVTIGGVCFLAATLWTD